MSDATDRDWRGERGPSRIPGEGDIELEAMAGDLQLGRKRALRRRRPTGRRVATARQWADEYHPNAPVPVSGVYSLVDADRRYLDFQVTCHEGTRFPPFPSSRSLDSEPSAYVLAYEAAHLQGHSGAETSAHAEREIFRPGQVVPTSGVYGVVDRDGRYLLYQRALVHEPHDHDPQTFPPTDEADPEAFGYVLQYEAHHLRSA